MLLAAPATAVAVNVALPTPDTTACALLGPTCGPRSNRRGRRIRVGGAGRRIERAAAARHDPGDGRADHRIAAGVGDPHREILGKARSGGRVVCVSASHQYSGGASRGRGMKKGRGRSGQALGPGGEGPLQAQGGPSARVTDVRPPASVTVVDELALPPASGVHVIVTPSIGLPKASVTCTTSGCGKAAPAAAVCSCPETMASPLADAATAETEKPTSTGCWSSGVTTVALPWVLPTVAPRTTPTVARPSPRSWRCRARGPRRELPRLRRRPRPDAR